MMIVTRLGHATLLIETDRARVLIDPGGYSHDWHDLTELDAVLVTHQHADHIDIDRASPLAAANPDARWLVEDAVTRMVDSAEPAAVGDSFDVGDLTVTVIGGRHAVIHSELDRIGNIGFLLQSGDGPRLFHPGDAYEYTPEGIDFLAIPLNAPWAKVSEAIEFTRSVGASNAFPIHDALLAKAGRAVYMRMLTGLLEGIEVSDLPVGEAWALD